MFTKVTRCIIWGIKCYQYCISPLFGRCCRFYPSCSSYALEAFKQFGLFRACFLVIKRLCRCHPWSDGGYDPVPLVTQHRCK